MNVRYFKKLQPTTKVLLSNGSKVEFTTLDGLLGYFATNDEYVAREFERFMSQERYCITEISEEEFNRDYRQKKTPQPISSAKWREEISGSSVLPKNSDPVARLGSERVQAAVGVSSAPKVGLSVADGAPPSASAPANAETPLQEFQPKTGTRKKKK